ncbi:MAG: helix-hairpin-helix domain-containing protein [Desulfobulbaceae bacterium]|nr:helix-hairpin-helix domain-containing protein [Desulfobulbaceae bacterium]
MCLLWDCAGPKGAGVYGRDQGGNTAVNPQLVSPRLAIFTFLRFDLNQVDADTLQIIKGIGPKLASAIVDYRVVHGPFHSVEELLAVRGIGPTKLISLRAHVMLPLIP